jgi:hypothetical protein
MMASRRASALLAVTLALVFSASLASCSGITTQGVTTSQAPNGSASSATSVSGQTTTPGDAGASTTVLDGEYAAQMRAWVTKYLLGMDTSAMKVTDPLNASGSEVTAAKDFASRLHTAITELKVITPAPQVKAAHSEFVAAIGDLSAAIDAYVLAMTSRNDSDLQRASALWAAAQSRVQTATSLLTPLLGMDVPV